MKKAMEFLIECGVFYLATVDGDQPRVRPFGIVFEYEEKLYIVTNNTKNCYKQMVANPKVEISAMNKKGEWIRLTGEVAVDDRRGAKEVGINSHPMLKKMYKVDDGVFAILYFTKGTVSICSTNALPETFPIY
jgi:uncharacterized pyridoxamine 5'-phosphate oxidase family protein